MVHIAASSPFQTQHVEPARGLQDVTELKNLFLDSLEQRFKGSPQDVNTLPANCASTWAVSFAFLQTAAA